jgi:F420-0:gamma-glutamyl ligase-like protein
LRKYSALAIRSEYWKPGTDYEEVIARLAGGIVHNGDTIVISEKAIAVAQGRIRDESRISPSRTAQFLAEFWMRKVWGYFLGPLSRMSRVNIKRMRNYPDREGAAHKQLSMTYSGLLQSLRHYSEGGIDVSNVPYAYACIPPEDVTEVAEKIKEHFEKKLAVNVDVMISDSDKTYSLRNVHFAPRCSFVAGIHCLGVMAFVLGRFLRLRPRSTPIAFTSRELDPDHALRIAAIANRARGDGAGKTVWDIAQRFGVDLTGVTWEMLESLPHYPVVIVRCS